MQAQGETDQNKLQNHKNDILSSISEKKGVSFTILVFFLVSVAFFLGYQNYLLRKQVDDLKTGRNTTAEAEVDKTKNWNTYTNSAHGYSFKFPQDLYPLVETYENLGRTEFYLTKQHAEKTIECREEQLGTPQEPCGFGWLVFTVEVYLNPQGNSNINRVYDANESLKESPIVDSQDRTWELVNDLPWAGSIMNITSTNFILSDGKKDVVVTVAKPAYSNSRINKEFSKELLSSFNFESE